MEIIQKEGQIKIPNLQELEEKILHRFYFLKEPDDFNKFYGDYDFDKEEDKTKVNVWEEILKYLFDEILECFAIKISDLIKLTKINDKEPKCLKKILQVLRMRGLYLLYEDLYSEQFYKKKFPDLYPKNDMGMMGEIISYFNPMSYIPKFKFCREETNKETTDDDNKNDFETNPKRIDLSEDEIKKEIPENSILFKYDNFQEHCKSLLIVLKEILLENDVSLIIKEDFINNVDVYYTEKKNNHRNGKFKLRYGIQYINESIHYLEKTKKIIIFPINSKNKQIYFIKIADDKDDSVKKEDLENAESILKDNGYLFEF